MHGRRYLRPDNLNYIGVEYRQKCDVDPYCVEAITVDVVFGAVVECLNGKLLVGSCKRV